MSYTWTARLDASLCSGLCVPTVKCPRLRTLHLGMCVGLRHARLWVPHLASLDLRNLPMEGGRSLFLSVLQYLVALLRLLLNVFSICAFA